MSARTLTHDTAVQALLAGTTRLSLAEVADGFVAGVGGSALRGRQTLVSYVKARYLVEHPYATARSVSRCGVCGMPEGPLSVGAEDMLRGLAAGACWNEPELSWVVDLEDAAEHRPARSTAEDRRRFRALLDLAAAQDPACTPGNFAKEVVRAKVLPLKGKFARMAVYGICEALGEVGVLPNRLVAPAIDGLVRFEDFAEAERRKGGSHRSDIIVPFGGWRGELGVDWQRARAVFPTVFVDEGEPAARGSALR